MNLTSGIIEVDLHGLKTEEAVKRAKNEVSKAQNDIEGFVKKLETFYPEVKYLNTLMTHSWGQQVVRFYDPDGNLIEVGTPM